MNKNKYKKKSDELVSEVSETGEEKETVARSNEKQKSDDDQEEQEEQEKEEQEQENTDETDVKKYVKTADSKTESSNTSVDESEKPDISKKNTEEYVAEIESLKKTNETLKAENETLKSELKAKDEEFDRSLDEMKINNAVEIAIREANGKNVKAIKALINFEEISLDNSGEVVGLAEQIETLKTAESSSFLFDENELVLKGVTPVSSAKTSGVTVADFQKMSYKERLELYNKDASLYKNLKY